MKCAHCSGRIPKARLQQPKTRYCGLRCKRRAQQAKKRKVACSACRGEQLARGTRVRGIKSCPACQANRAAIGSYYPIELTLEAVSVRILRRLYRDGWVHACDLLDSLGVCDWSSEYSERDRYNTTLSRLSKLGSVERRKSNHVFLGLRSSEYRITPLGRQRLEAMLHYDTSVATDEEADLDAVIAVFGSLDVPELETA
jgi:hypothetical protein